MLLMPLLTLTVEPLLTMSLYWNLAGCILECHAQILRILVLLLIRKGALENLGSKLLFVSSCVKHIPVYIC